MGRVKSVQGGKRTIPEILEYILGHCVFSCATEDVQKAVKDGRAALKDRKKKLARKRT